MTDNESLFSAVEEKIRILGEKLIAANSQNAALKDEIGALKNKMAGLEELLDESGNFQNGRHQADQMDSIKKKLDKYIDEVAECIDLVKEM